MRHGCRRANKKSPPPGKGGGRETIRLGETAGAGSSQLQVQAQVQVQRDKRKVNGQVQVQRASAREQGQGKVQGSKVKFKRAPASVWARRAQKRGGAFGLGGCFKEGRTRCGGGRRCRRGVQVGEGETQAQGARSSGFGPPPSFCLGILQGPCQGEATPAEPLKEGCMIQNGSNAVSHSGAPLPKWIDSRRAGPCYPWRAPAGRRTRRSP